MVKSRANKDSSQVQVPPFPPFPIRVYQALYEDDKPAARKFAKDWLKKHNALEEELSE